MEGVAEAGVGVDAGREVGANRRAKKGESAGIYIPTRVLCMSNCSTE